METTHQDGPTYSHIDEKLMVIHNQDAYDFLYTLTKLPDEVLFADLNLGLNMVANYHTAQRKDTPKYSNVPYLTIDHHEGTYLSGTLSVAIHVINPDWMPVKLELVTVVECDVIFEDNYVIAIKPKYANQ